MSTKKKVSTTSKKTQIASILTKTSATIQLNGKIYNITSTHPGWKEIIAALKRNDSATLEKVLNVSGAIKRYSKGKFTVTDNQVLYGGEVVDNYVVERIFEFNKQGLPVDPLFAFMEKLLKNPSKNSVDQLYKFLEHKNLPITPSGNFLAYKGVTADYWSITAGSIKTLVQGKVGTDGRILNTVGSTIELERNKVCDDKNIGCAAGLHAGSMQYATDFGRSGKVVIVEIDPSDVVSVPHDCSHQKLRTSKYSVVGEYENPLDNDYCDKYSNTDSTSDNDLSLEW